MTGQLDIGYEDGMVKSDDGHVYVYGERTKPETFGHHTLLHVARFAHDNPTDWTFWDGATWASAPSTRSEEHTSELQSLMRISYAVFCLNKKTERQTAAMPHSDNSYLQRGKHCL